MTFNESLPKSGHVTFIQSHSSN